jgi:apolipoprotein N-acyltransferase
MKQYFNKYSLKSGLLVALFLSLPIYLIHFDINLKLINTISFLVGLYYLFYADKKFYPLIGFFIGIFWFWWIGLSFRYYDLYVMVPIVIILGGVIYSLFFWLISLLKHKFFISLFFIYGFDYITIFGFDWFKLDFLLVTTYFGVYKLNLILIFLAIWLVQYYKFLSLFLLLLATLSFSHNIKEPNLKIKLQSTEVRQDLKWERENTQSQIDNVFYFINRAIDEKYDMVIFPETVFPLGLNFQEYLIQELKEKSKKITIIVGGIKYQDNLSYNSTYIFDNQNMRILDKHILVPFGEYTPLPKFMQKFVNETFFNGAEDYKSAPDFGRFETNGYRFLNAICYEATVQKLYEQKESFIIASSNNAWYLPSIEPTLQKIIIKFYATKFHKIVYHATNLSKSYRILP